MASDRCISEPARAALTSAIQRLETCPEGPIIRRTKPRYGHAVYREAGKADKEYPHMAALLANFPGGYFRYTKSGVGCLQKEGFPTEQKAFENPAFCKINYGGQGQPWEDLAGTPFTDIYTVTQGTRRGLPYIIISNERPNPALTSAQREALIKRAKKE